MSHLSHSFFISTAPLELELDGCTQARVGGFSLGAFSPGPLATDDTDALGILLETLTLTADLSDVPNLVGVEGPTLRVTGSAMNTQALFYIDDAPRRFVVFNDLFLAPHLLRACAVEPVYDPERFADDLTFFAGVSRLRAGERLRVDHDGDVARVELSRSPSILADPGPVHADLETSKRAVLDALQRAVQSGLGGALQANVALSGGVDSGTIAALIFEEFTEQFTEQFAEQFTKLGARLRAYTLGTPWGDEFEAAEETAAHLGIATQRVALSVDDIVGEVRSVIRYFFFVSPESVEIALVAHCLYKTLAARGATPALFLTGYGSDLLNGAGPLAALPLDKLHAGIVAELQRTQLSNEFSNLSALRHGVRVGHPFWDPAVIRESLRVPAAHKRRGDQDKHYLREMMVGRLPAATAWRTKLGAHHGTGLAHHLHQHLSPISTDYRRAILTLHEDIFANGNYP